MEDLATNGWQVFFEHVPPGSIARYCFPEDVTPENFISFISRGFLVSRGNAERNILWLDFVAAHTGFPFREAFHYFLDIGGWDALTAEEQVLFTEDLERVKAHHKSDDEIPSVVDDFYAEPALRFNEQVGEAALGKPRQLVIDDISVPLGQIPGEKEFLRLLDLAIPPK